MKEIPSDCEFKVLGVYAANRHKNWQLLKKFNDESLTGIFSLSNFNHYKIKFIRSDEYWLYNFNGLTDESGDYRLRLKIRVINA